ncbi:MAG: sensor domain-containing diguanylate cyclase [Deltaproteobacteria bacterium]|nr:sensor domain-containing diguanylate cyclase [Deltaproteobacteria bacterium]
MDLRSLEGREITRFLEGLQGERDLEAGADLDTFFCQILAKANEFVPSEAGSILLLDPAGAAGGAGRLVFVTSFGEKSADLLGRSISAAEGIVGQTLQSGKSYISREVNEDAFFAKEFAAAIGFPTRSIICVPIRIDREILGVIELLNRREVKRFSEAEMGLLEIFASYISTSIRNILDARLFNEMARRDDLTGLFNDRWFHHHLEDEIVAARGDDRDLSVVFFDLDNFKSVNDRFGHLAGSRTLHETGRLLARVVTAPEATLARYGGDEFVVILPGTGPEEAMAVGGTVRKSIEDFVFLAESSRMVAAHAIAGCVTASVGVQSLSRLGDGGGKEQLLREADAAMYQSKALGKNCVTLYAPA